jgi:hypothetical protein
MRALRDIRATSQKRKKDAENQKTCLARRFLGLPVNAGRALMHNALLGENLCKPLSRLDNQFATQKLDKSSSIYRA